MVWKLDRFGRSALDVLANIRDLDAAGVRFTATTQGIDIRPGGDAMSRLILGVLASVAEFERDLIRSGHGSVWRRLVRPASASGALVSSARSAPRCSGSASGVGPGGRYQRP